MDYGEILLPGLLHPRLEPSEIQPLVLALGLRLGGGDGPGRLHLGLLGRLLNEEGALVLNAAQLLGRFGPGLLHPLSRLELAPHRFLGPGSRRLVLPGQSLQRQLLRPLHLGQLGLVGFLDVRLLVPGPGHLQLHLGLGDRRLRRRRAHPQLLFAVRGGGRRQELLQQLHLTREGGNAVDLVSQHRIERREHADQLLRRPDAGQKYGLLVDDGNVPSNDPFAALGTRRKDLDGQDVDRFGQGRGDVRARRHPDAQSIGIVGQTVGGEGEVTDGVEAGGGVERYGIDVGGWRCSGSSSRQGQGNGEERREERHR